MRVVLLAAAQLCCAGFMRDTACAGGWPTVWSDLWHTPDQQGQAMLDAGEAAQAAARFRDPRRRAYADIETGHFGEAVRLLAPFRDVGSEYNRGNALAGSGQLQAALAAYDAALTLAPDDAAARPSGSSSQQPNAPQASAERNAGNPEDATGEARSDAAFAAANARKPQQQHGTGGAGQMQAPDAGTRTAGGTDKPQEPSESERQLMLDQWLRQVPDSPAGLLQRQFLIDHMMKQQASGE